MPDDTRMLRDRLILDRAAGLVAAFVGQDAAVDDGAVLHCLVALCHLTRAGASLEAAVAGSRSDPAGLLEDAVHELAELSLEAFDSDAVLDALDELQSAREMAG